MTIRRVTLIIIGAIVGLFIALQLVQFAMPGFPPENPPVQNTVNWDSQQTATLWDNACADCHSNETDWPFYSYIAPASFLAVSHVENGREELNVSTGGEIEADEMVEVIREGHSPRDTYVILHPEAQLDQTERDQLMNGIRATFGGTDESGEMENNAPEPEEDDEEDMEEAFEDE